MPTLKWLAYVLLAITLLWMIFHRESIVWTSVVIGSALTVALFIQVFFFQHKREAKLSDEAKQSIEFEWQMRIEQIHNQASQTIDKLNQEMQKLQQKTIRSEQQRISYQKLMDIHKQEIENLSCKNQLLAEQLTQNMRKLSAVTFSQREFDLFRPVEQNSQV